MRRFNHIWYGLLALGLLAGCDQSPGNPQPAPAKPAVTPVSQPAPTAPGAEAQSGPATASQPIPPAPPVAETFEAKPQLSLFPRVGSYRPEDDQTKQLGYWKTFMEHLVRTSGVIQDGADKTNHVFALRGVKDIDSSGFFSPLAVEPGQTYRLRFRNRGQLSADEQAGVGLLEFDQFLWLPGQYPESVVSQHLVGRQQLIQLQSSDTWQPQEVVFTTGPSTRMIHLIFYRDGKVNRKPLLLDDIRIDAVGKAGK